MEVLTPNNKAIFYGRLIVLIFLIRIITLYPFHSPEYIFYGIGILGMVLPNLKKKLCKIIVDGENLELVYKTIFNSSSKKFNRADINIRVEEKGKMVNGKKEKLIFSENDNIIDEITTANFKDNNYKQLCN